MLAESPSGVEGGRPFTRTMTSSRAGSVALGARVVWTTVPAYFLSRQVTSTSAPKTKLACRSPV